MPVNAAIPMSGQGPKMMDPMQMMSLQQVSQQMQMQRQAMDEKNELRGALRGAADPSTGRLTPQGISGVTQLDPQLGLRLTEQQEKLRLLDIANNDQKNEFLKNIGTTYVTAYDRYLQQTGGNKEQALNLARRDALSAVDAMERSGVFAVRGMDQQTIAGFRDLPDPEQARAIVTAFGGKLDKPVDPTIGKLEPKDYTPESWEKYLKSHNSAELRKAVAVREPPTGHRWRADGTLERIPGYSPGADEKKVEGVPPALQQYTGEEYLKRIPANESGLIKGIAEGRISPSSLSIRGGHREKVLQQVTQYDPTFDATNFGARAGVRKDFTSGVAARNVTAINTAIGHIGTLDELGDALKNKDTRVLNAVFNKIATETGNSNVNNFEIARDAVGNELMRVFRQVNASEAETREWASKFKAANSPEQLKGAVKVAAELLQSRIEALDDQWKRGMSTDKGYPNLLSPKSQKVMEKVKGNQGGPYSDTEKEKRYQEWKKQQGG